MFPLHSQLSSNQKPFQNYFISVFTKSKAFIFVIKGKTRLKPINIKHKSFVFANFLENSKCIIMQNCPSQKLCEFAVFTQKFSFRRAARPFHRVASRLQKKEFRIIPNSIFSVQARTYLIFRFAELLAHPFVNKAANSVQIVGGEIVNIDAPFVAVTQC